MTRPRLLDLFCGAGGCSVGYDRAGFDVTGVDIEPHADYPFEMIIADALGVLSDQEFLGRFDAIHASPPCPRYSVATQRTRAEHPDLVPVVRGLLTAWGGTWVIENVPGAPMPGAITICGWAVSVFGHSGEDRRRATLAVHGHRVGHVTTAEVRKLLGVEWMTRREDISDAIPPAYTEHLGVQLIDQMEQAA